MTPRVQSIVLCVIAALVSHRVQGFPFSPQKASVVSSSPSTGTTPHHCQPVGNILILDHVNINHEKGRHDWLKAFYFDFLKCAADPRKIENLEKGRKTLWANIGANQFHLSEGTPQAQVLEGVITLAYPDLTVLEHRYPEVLPELETSQFTLKRIDSNVLSATDPWGNQFRLVQTTNADERDARGQQPGEVSEGYALRDLTLYTPVPCNMAGIARFYQHIFDAPVLQLDNDSCVISVGPQQTLTFTVHPHSHSFVQHDDLREEPIDPLPPDSHLYVPSNYGPHVSMYVANLPECFRKADELGVVYVNPRFKRRAYTLDQAIDDCMFRCLDIIDPENVDEGVILKLEHEIRSVVERDGSKYKSCPFNEIPDACKIDER